MLGEYCGGKGKHKDTHGEHYELILRAALRCHRCGLSLILKGRKEIKCHGGFKGIVPVWGFKGGSLKIEAQLAAGVGSDSQK